MELCAHEGNEFFILEGLEHARGDKDCDKCRERPIHCRQVDCEGLIHNQHTLWGVAWRCDRCGRGR